MLSTQRKCLSLNQISHSLRCNLLMFLTLSGHSIRSWLIFFLPSLLGKIIFVIFLSFFLSSLVFLAFCLSSAECATFIYNLCDHLLMPSSFARCFAFSYLSSLQTPTQTLTHFLVFLLPNHLLFLLKALATFRSFRSAQSIVWKSLPCASLAALSCSIHPSSNWSTAQWRSLCFPIFIHLFNLAHKFPGVFSVGRCVCVCQRLGPSPLYILSAAACFPFLLMSLHLKLFQIVSPTCFLNIDRAFRQQQKIS